MEEERQTQVTQSASNSAPQVEHAIMEQILCQRRGYMIGVGPILSHISSSSHAFQLVGISPVQYTQHLEQ